MNDMKSKAAAPVEELKAVLESLLDTEFVIAGLEKLFDEVRHSLDKLGEDELYALGYLFRAMSRQHSIATENMENAIHKLEKLEGLSSEE